MVEQGTDAWHADRLGKVTASRVADVMAKTKSGYSTSRANYMAQLVCERLTGLKGESYSNAAMEWGNETEPLARAEYEVRKGVFVDQVGFIDHPTIPMAGASPDGCIGTDGLIEIKCPNTATHLEYLLGKTVPPKYKPQMAWQLICTGRTWCDFVSFDPRLPERHQFFCIGFEPSKEYLDEVTQEVVKFISDLDKMINQLENKQ